MLIYFLSQWVESPAFKQLRETGGREKRAKTGGKAPPLLQEEADAPNALFAKY